MAVKFSIANGGFIQDSVGSKLSFQLDGELFQPLLESVGAPLYNKSSFNISSATLLADGQIGQFEVSIRSYNSDGTSEVFHASGTVTVSSAGPLKASLTISNATIASDKVVKILARHISGTPSSNISVTLE